MLVRIKAIDSSLNKSLTILQLELLGQRARTGTTTAKAPSRVSSTVKVSISIHLVPGFCAYAMLVVARNSTLGRK